jgi:hypothetical protein
LEAINNQPLGTSITDSWMEEIWALVKKIRRWTKSSIPPEINKGAWVLAKFVSPLKDSRTWIEEVSMILVVKINCLRKIKEERKRSNTQIKNTRIYVVRQYAYIHRRRQGESFTKKIRRLQQWYQDSLKEPKPQLHPNLSLT